jgi:hypothetical protein
MEKDTKKGIGMISAASEALNYRKEHPAASNEQIMGHVSKFIAKERDSSLKLPMVAAASKALTIAERAPDLSDKQIIGKVMNELPLLMDNTD